MTTLSRRFQLQRKGASFTIQNATTETPQPGPGQVLLRMHAASLNYRDLLATQDTASNQEGLVPLSDGAGEIVALGEGVNSWSVGERVMPNFFPLWQSGPFSSSYLSQALGGGATDGVLRDHMAIAAKALVKIPDHLSYGEAATLPCAGLTAWHALFERGNIQAGDTVLVQGTGGVALFGLQLATALGARVIVTSSSDKKLARASALGAWKTINYKNTPDWDRVALEMTDGRGVDHILELGGPDTYDRSINAIAAGGRIAQIGVLTGFASRPNILPLQFKNATIHGICVGSVEQLARLAAFMGKHQIRPVIDEVFGFDASADAYDHLSAANHFGKLVIQLK